MLNVDNNRRHTPSTHSVGAFQRYPKNAWYVAAGREEVGRNPIGRKLVDEQIVLFRKENGDPVALQDNCPHRGFRFSSSRIIGDTIQCGYHGMVFNAQGRCVKMPLSGKIPEVMRVRAFPLVEKRHFIWIWVGDPSKAEPALIPRAPYEDDDSYDHQFYYPLPFAANFQLAQDNLLDTTHGSYLHAGLIDNEDNTELLAAEITSKVEGTVINRVLTMKGFVANASVAKVWHVPVGKPLTRIITVTNALPCAVNIQNQFFDPADGNKIVSERCTNIGLTPADKNHGYHFTAVSSSFRQTEQDKQAQLDILTQDMSALEMVQRHFEEYPDTAVEISVQMDRLGVLARRLLDDMVEKEGV